MKYLILLCDGMADEPCPALEGKTPMEAAHKPNMDRLASAAEVGMVRTVPPGMKPGSDVANLSVMGYDPAVYYTGRSPLEAASLGVALRDDDLALRCNLVTLSQEASYKEKTMVDYSGGDISSEEAAVLIAAVNDAFGGGRYEFHPGVSYRHCLVAHECRDKLDDLTPPHDISGKVIGPYLSAHEQAVPLLAMMEQSCALLADHPINRSRLLAGKRPANAIWLWGAGRRPVLPSFRETYGVQAGVVSAVDLIKGIGVLADMCVADVPGATGYIDTDFEGKAAAAAALYDAGCDLVYLHVEAPDECGHRGEAQNKCRAIEWIDRRVLGPLLQTLDAYGDYRVLLLPDHPTPLSKLTHTADPVPYLLYQKGAPLEGTKRFTETAASRTGHRLAEGFRLMARLLRA